MSLLHKAQTPPAGLNGGRIFEAKTGCNPLPQASLVTLAHWRAGRLTPSWTFHLGGLLVGWGLFNLVEGMVDHHLLGVHHVRDDLGAPLAWDLGFLAVGALLVVGGVLLQRAGGRSMRPQVAADG